MESISQTYARLRLAQKGRARGAPAYSVFVNRPVGRLFAAVAYRIGLTPNQVTLISALFTFTGIALLAIVPASVVLGVVVWLLLAIGYALDSADGQVARLRGGGSLAGEWLDHFVDAIKISSLHLAVLVGLSRSDDIPQTWLLVPVAFTIVANTTFFAMILNDLLKGKQGVASAHSTGGGGALRSVLLLPTDYGILMLAFVLWGWPVVFFGVYSLLLVACSAFLVLAAVTWFRQMVRLDRETVAP
ncbi:CDP-alcohol phosphatidyltransferase family protein [Microbacterium sp. NPDC057407]|uniref:CDP-alcohol phosphatidyltransferase family protein n=1 Tax=Microbacterium sp. NPDC057407 TaxID=3346120 RepID=UPI00366B5CEA